MSRLCRFCGQPMKGETWEVFRAIATIFLVCCALLILVVGAMVYYTMVKSATAPPRRGVAPAEAWKDEEADVNDWATGSYPGIATHGLGYPVRRRSPSRVVPVAYFDESARRALREIATQHEDAEGV